MIILYLQRLKGLWSSITGQEAENTFLLFKVSNSSRARSLCILSQKPLLWRYFVLYILILTENGIFGVGLFLILYLKAPSQAKRTWQGLFLGILVLGFLGSFDHYFITLIQGQRLLALVIGLAFSTRNKEFSSNWRPRNYCYSGWYEFKSESKSLLADSSSV